MTATRLLIAVAGVYGAVGVVLAALGAHAHAGSSLPTAAQMLLFHAPAIIAVALARKAGLVHDGLSRGAAWGLVIGTFLFAGDIAARVLAGNGLFPMAAPAGGMVMIASWCAVALAALLRAR